MPATNTGGSTDPTSEASAIMEPLGLDAGALGDSDFASLSLQHTSDQFTNSDLETLNFQTELELDNITPDDAVLMEEYDTGEVASEETVECVEIDGTVDDCEYLYEDEQPEAILPDIEDEPEVEELATYPQQEEEQLKEEIQEEMEEDFQEELHEELQEELQEEFVDEPEEAPTTVAPQSQPIMLIQSPSGGGGHIAVSGGQIIGRVSSGGNVTMMQQSTLKRPAPSGAPTRNVFAKVIIQGSPGTQQGQPMTSGHVKLMSSPTTRAITLAQAQQMGLISPSKLQQILPSSSSKQSGTIKIMGSPMKTHPKLVMQSSTLKSPTKILPAPASNAAQLKPGTLTTGGTTVHTTIKPGMSSQKVFIRQGPFKPGTVLTSSMGSSGQVIRIPASNVSGNRPVQYVRLVSAGGSTGSTVTTTARPRMVAVTTSSGGSRPIAITRVRTINQPVKMVPIAPATPTIRLASPKSVQQPGQRILIPTQETQLRATASGGQTILPTSSRNITYMLPAQYVQQVRNSPALPATVLASAPTPTTTPAASRGISAAADSFRAAQQQLVSIEANGIRPRKPCNCTKSQCLKLYCDCFANGEFCYMCNCNNCFNNLQHEEERQTAIKSCLERNTTAFRPKIGKSKAGDERRHNKGCNCKRSGCLKNYCECYEAKISCSNNCKCVGCRNVEEPTERSALRDLADAAESRVYQMALKREQNSPNPDKNRMPSSHAIKPQFNFVTSAVVSATVECMAAIAEESEVNKLSEEVAERLMIEEFGRCLKQVIFISDRADAAITDAAKSGGQGSVATT